MKQILFNKVYELEEETYKDLINKTAKLIERPYVQTLMMLKHLEPSQIDYLYNECVHKWKEKKFKSPARMWWTEKKKL